jgi:hypothetical protein
LTKKWDVRRFGRILATTTYDQSNWNDDIAHENAVLTAILQLRLFLRNDRGLSQRIVTDFAMVSAIDKIDHRSFDRARAAKAA